MLHFGPFEGAILFLIIVIGTCIFSFSHRYMAGDLEKRSFSIRFFLILGCTALTVLADHVGALLCFMCMGNVLLTRLITHKPQWDAARASGKVARIHFILGAVLMGVAVTLLARDTGTTSIMEMNAFTTTSSALRAPLLLLLLGAMVQSGLWPFHRWLICSVNAPTPVSALMHAGLINGGGILLIKFAHLYLRDPALLNILFGVGVFSATLGIFWKLIQPNVKGMLACSTLGQMGFMFAQCGLGFFPAAAGHLVWHGLFKAYLFLGSGSAGQEKRFHHRFHAKPLTLFLCVLVGFWGSLVFGHVTGKSWHAQDTSLFLMVLSFITTTQFSNTLLFRVNMKQIAVCFLACTLFGAFYGASVSLFTLLLEEMHIWQPQPLNELHFCALGIFIISWVFPFFVNRLSKQNRASKLLGKIYVSALNASQPLPSTQTLFRKTYKFV